MEGPLLGGNSNCCAKHAMTYIVLAIIAVVVVLVVVLIVVLRKDDSEETSSNSPYKVLLKDSDFIKPKIKFDAEFQLVKTKTDMLGLLIDDEYLEYSLVYLYMPNGSYTETVPGLAHFGEHMVSGGSKKYPNIVPVYNPIIGGVDGGEDNAATGGTEQFYYMKVPYNFLFENVIDLLTDSFKYPFYDKDVVKKEIQAVNAEFYFHKTESSLILEAILQQLSSTKTSFNGMATGNNETLNPNDSDNLAKKLRGYHSLIKKPNNIFFSLASNETMETLEKYTEKYFTYKMHEFKDDEIDKEDRNQLIENEKNIVKFDIFDENLYNHGFYYNSKSKLNYLFLFYNLGDIDYNDLQFEVIDFIKYLSNSKYLKDYLIQEGYFLFYDVTFFTEIKNNNIIQFIFQITNEAVENIDKVLLIIYKYIEIMKSKGYEKKYFEDFIKLKRNKQILEFNKNAFKDINSFLESKIRNYRLYGKNQIFTDGTPAIENYNENKIKELLNKFKYEKSFFGLNSYAKFTEYQTKTFLESTEIKTLKYYKSQYLYGKMPDNFKTRIEQYNNENIKIRDLSKYCSEKYESVVPCYKDKSKNCTELNEFDYLKEDEYNATKLEEENSDYITYYQIDKSSESHKVHSYIEINLINEAQYIGLIKSYIELKISEINELNNIIVATPNLDCVSLEITSFSDNTELLINCLLNLLISELNQNDLDLLESNLIYTNMERLELSLSHYTINLFAQFMKGQKAENNLDLIIKQIHEVMNLFKSYYNEYFIKSIDYIDFKIAGNINKELVQNIHNSIKTKLPSVQHNNFILKQPKLINDNESYIINYYQKSEKIDEPDNAILVMYQYESKYARILQILASCFKMEAIPLLRFNFSNAYSPKE